MKLPGLVRYVLIAALVAASFVPQFLTVGVFGELNLWLLIVLWLVLFACYLKVSKGVAWAATIIGALAMAIPPVPNYVSVSNGLHLTWIGWGNLLEGSGLYGIVFFFVFYALVFGAAAWLLRRKSAPAP